MISYEPLLRQLKKKHISKTELRRMTGMSSATLAKLTANQFVSMQTLDDICDVLDCEIVDVLEYKKSK